MRFIVEEIRSNPIDLLRRAGYTFKYKEGDEMSFIYPLSRSGYPRFHMFVKLEGRKMNVSIHLDQKRETYGDSTRHHGEYEDSPALTQEVTRIKRFL